MKVNDIGKTSKSRIAEKISYFTHDDIVVGKELPAKWEVDRERGWICCTRCHGEMTLIYINGTFHKERFKSPYCPHCGAKMENGVPAEWRDRI